MPGYYVLKRIKLHKGTACSHMLKEKALHPISCKQGDLDGACGAYSLIMALDILGVFNAEKAQNFDIDGRSKEAKLLKSLAEKGSLMRDGLDISEVSTIIRGSYSSKVVISELKYDWAKDEDFLESVVKSIEANEPVILFVRFDKKNAHWTLVVGYEYDEKDNVTKFLLLDPGSEAPRMCCWNSLLELSSKNKNSHYKHTYFDGLARKIALGDSLSISLK